MRGELRHEIPTKNQTFFKKVTKNHLPQNKKPKTQNNLLTKAQPLGTMRSGQKGWSLDRAWILLRSIASAGHTVDGNQKSGFNSPVEVGSWNPIYTLGCHTVEDRNSAPDGMYKTLRSQTNGEAVKICHDTDVIYWIHALHLQSYSLKWDMQNNSKTPNNSKHLDFSVYSNVAHL